MIEWNKTSEKLPTEAPNIYLIVYLNNVVMMGFYDSQGRWMNYPDLDDLENDRVTHWAEINLPGEEV